MKHKSSSSGKKNYRTDSSNRKRKRSDASDFKSKYNDSKSKSRDRRDKGKIPIGEQCRRTNCRQRGTNNNHRHQECRYKGGDQTSHEHPNLGKVPSKNKDNKSNSDASSQVRSYAPASANNDCRCYICNDPNHLANAFPQKGKNKQDAKKKLAANRNFMALFEASFPKPEPRACASRMG